MFLVHFQIAVAYETGLALVPDAGLRIRRQHVGQFAVRMNRSVMDDEIFNFDETQIRTDCARELFDPVVNFLVSDQFVFSREGFSAGVALERFKSGVNVFVAQQFSPACERLVAHRALVWFHPGVCHHVRSQVSNFTKPFVADFTLECGLFAALLFRRVLHAFAVVRL